MRKAGRIKHIHFIGAGGVSMSALIKLSLKLGKKVSGSDIIYSSALDELAALGAEVYVGHSPKTAEQADLVVYTAAVPENDLELTAAKAANCKVLTRAEYLGEISNLFKNVIAVAGTHGKTTATALISAVYKKAELDFCAHVGGEVEDIGGNFYFRGFDTLVTEACEYKKSLLELSPTVGVILNVESDHPDCYKNLSELYSVFDCFVKNTQESGGSVILNGDSIYAQECIGKYVNIITFGFGDMCNIRAVNMCECEGKYSYDVYMNNSAYLHINSSLYGQHNIYNELAAIAVCAHKNIDKNLISEGIESFNGIKRRFDKVADLDGAVVISDYAHHPKEILSVIAAAKKICKRKLSIYFQPHTFSRTREYFDGFVDALATADEVYIYKTYPAREEEKDGLSACDLFMGVNKKRIGAYFSNPEKIWQNIKDTARNGDLILLLGAGDMAEKVMAYNKVPE